MSKLGQWFASDYKVPKSFTASFATIVSLTILIGCVTLAELLVDLYATSLKLMVPALIMNIALVILVKKHRYTRFICNFQLLILFLLIQLHLYTLPGTFHVVVYWMTSVPLLSFTLGGIRTTRVWTVVTILTLFADAMYGMYVIGSTYNVTVYYLPTAIAGSIFASTLVIGFSLIYNLLGRAYSDLKAKNSEIERLNNELQEVNSSLEETVEKRTNDIENKNVRLKKFVFMNSHLVRAPLTNIIGAVEHLETVTDEGEIRDVVGVIGKASKDLDKVIKEVGESLSNK